MDSAPKKILVLCPLKSELDFLVDALREQSIRIVEERVGPLKIFSAPDLNLKLAPAGHGKTQFGIQTQYLLNRDPTFKLVLCVGCAGALSDQLRFGDIVVAEKTLEHDFKIRFFKKAIPEFAGDPDWLRKISLLNLTTEFKIHFGNIASGDEDVISRERAIEIANQTKALAVAWEGAGGARACQFNSVPFVELRGITDMADEESPRDFKLRLKVVMTNLGHLLLAMSK